MKVNTNTYALIKYNLQKCYRKNIIISTLIITLITCVLYMVKIAYYSSMSENPVNQWDYFFRIFQNPFILIWLFVPILFFITAPISELSNKSKYIYIRVNKKHRVLLAEQLTNLIIVTAYIVLFAAVVFLLGIYYSRFGAYWSKAILNENNNQIATEYLFFNNFIFTYNPIEAMLMSILKFIGTIYLILLFRDFIIYLTKRNIIAIFACFSYLMMQYYSITSVGYISIANLATIWCHKFQHNQYSGADFDKYTTVTMSNITLILTIFILFILSVVVYRRKDSERV